VKAADVLATAQRQPEQPLYDTLPGYLPMPRGDGTETTLRDYLARQTKPTGLWHSLPAYFIRLLKAYYGKNATVENDFGYNWIPKITSNHSFFEYLYDMADGKMEGMFMMGPESGGRCGKLQVRASVAVEIEMAGRSRDGRNRSGDVLA
jgi:formate dehydrogenase major subunit